MGPAPGDPGSVVKLPDQLIADFRGFVGASGSRDPVGSVKLPNSPEEYHFSGIL